MQPPSARLLMAGCWAWVAVAALLLGVGEGVAVTNGVRCLPLLQTNCSQAFVVDPDGRVLTLTGSAVLALFVVLFPCFACWSQQRGGTVDGPPRHAVPTVRLHRRAVHATTRSDLGDDAPEDDDTGSSSHGGAGQRL